MYLKTTYDQDFDDLYMHLKSKYPQKLFDLDGIGKQTDLSLFSKKFFASQVTSDASVDANANVDTVSVITYNTEMPKPFFRLNSYYVMWKKLKQLYGLDVANTIVEMQLTGDIYIHDFHGVAAGQPYSYCGDDVLILHVDGELMLDNFQSFFDRFAHNVDYDKLEDIGDATFIPLTNVKVQDADGEWVDVKRIVRHRTDKNLIHIMTGNGTCIIVTDDHPVILEDGSEKLACDLEYGDKLAMSHVELPRREQVQLEDAEAYYIGYRAAKWTIINPNDTYTRRFSKTLLTDDLMYSQYDIDIQDDPNRVLTWNERAIKQYVAGLIDYAGQVDTHNGHISILSTDITTVSTIQSLWDGLGLGQSYMRFCTDGLEQFEDDEYTDIYYELLLILHDQEMEEYSELVKANAEALRNPRYTEEFQHPNDNSIVKLDDSEKWPFVYDITTSTGTFSAMFFKCHNCFNYSTYDLMVKGLDMVHKIKCVPPKHLSAFKSQLEQFVVLASNSTLGATGLADFLVVMSYYVKNILDTLSDAHFSFASVEDCWAYVKDKLTSFIYTVNQPMRANQCVTADTQVLTPTGFKNYWELDVGDPIYTLTENGTVEVQPILAVNEFDYDGDMYVFTSPFTHLYQQVTPNHNVAFIMDTDDGKEIARLAAEQFTHCNYKDTHIPVAPIQNVTDVFPVKRDMLKDAIEELLQLGVYPDWLPYLSRWQAREALQCFIELVSHICAEDKTIDIELPAHLCTARAMVAEICNDFQMDALQHLAFLAGYHCEVLDDNEGTRLVAVFPQKEVVLTDIRKTDYQGTVWCPTVENGIVVFRDSNGSVYISGNSPFTNVSVYDDNFLEKLKDDYIFPDGSSPDLDVVRHLQEMYLDIINEELKRTPLTFPVTTACFSVDSEGNLLDEKFLDMIAEKNKDFGFINIYCGDSSTLSSCCRLRSEQKSEYFNSFGAGSSKIGSLGVCSINFPRLAIKAAKGRSKEDARRVFLAELPKMVEVCARVNNAKRHIVQSRIDNGNEPLYTHGFMELSKQYSTVGVNGFNECIEILGESIVTEEGQQLGLEIMNILNRENSKYEKQYNAPHNCEQVPGENMSIKMAEKDKLLKYQTKWNLYSNQFIPLITGASMLDRIKIQGTFDKHFSGGRCYLSSYPLINRVNHAHGCPVQG